MSHAPIRPPAAVRPLSEQELDELQAVLDRVPAPLEPLDVTMLDGYLCGVLLQPQRVPEGMWFAHVCDVDGRPVPPRFDVSRLRELATRRHAELNAAIVARQWFDPWVFELESEGDEPEATDDEDGFGEAPPEVDAVYPWVAGFATAVDLFPGLMQLDEQRLTEPLALLYQHLQADDLEDAEALLAEIETLEPPTDLTEAVETLVRATLLLADISRPQRVAAPARPPGRRPGGRPNGPPRRR